MKIYLLSQNINRGYDTYDSMVVIAKDEEEARNIHPCGEWRTLYRIGAWANNQSEVQVEYIGEASEDLTASGIICSSFNAG